MVRTVSTRSARYFYLVKGAHCFRFRVDGAEVMITSTSNRVAQGPPAHVPIAKAREDYRCLLRQGYKLRAAG